MRLHVRGSLGLVAAVIEGEVETSELTPDQAGRATALLTPEGLRAARIPTNRNLTDPEAFEITLLPDDPGGTAQRFTLSQRDTAPEVLELARELLGLIVRRKAAEQRRDKP